MPEGKPVFGVTSLGEEIYLLRWKGRVEVYDVINYCLQRYLTLPHASGSIDMTSCRHFMCLYIANDIARCIHRLDLQGNAEQWPVNDEPTGLSVNADHNLIVTCRRVRKIKEFSPRGELVRYVILPDDVINPWHAIQLTSGQFIVCHGRSLHNDQVHRVCKISLDGRHIVQSHGGQSGPDTGQYKVPRHLAVDDNNSVLVLDLLNCRVTSLSPMLNHIRQVVSRNEFKWCPRRLYLDVQRRRLYVTDNDNFNEGNTFTAGRVVVFSV